MRFYSIAVTSFFFTTANYTFLKYLINQNEARKDWYDSLPEDQRKKLHDECPLNRYGFDFSVGSALEEHRLMFNQGENQKANKIVPYIPSPRNMVK